MTDADLAKFLGLGPDEHHLLARFTPEQRAKYEALADKVMEVQLYDAGLGPKPAGVIVCGPRQIRGAR